MAASAWLIRRGPGLSLAANPGLSLAARKAWLQPQVTLWRMAGTGVGEGYLERNRKMGRPLSPSLKLLAAHPHPVWLFSFGHRFSGAVLTACVSTVSIGYLAVAMKGGTFADLASAVEGVQQFPVVWTTGKFVMALPICYHLINGVRHLNWDLGNGFDMKVVVGAGYAVVVLSIGAALGLALYTPAK